MKKDKYNVAVVGATGAVGEQMREVLEGRLFPLEELRLLASDRIVPRILAAEELVHDFLCPPILLRLRLNLLELSKMYTDGGGGLVRLPLQILRELRGSRESPKF